MKIENLESLKADLWIFDNDGTLYANTKEIEKEVVRLMIGFIAEEFKITIPQAVQKRKELLEKHCTEYTLVAMKNEGFDENIFIQKTYLSADPESFGFSRSKSLRKLLQSLEGEKVVLTNNPSEYAEMVLGSLGVYDLFSRVYGMRELSYIQKPNPMCFFPLEQGVQQGKKIVYIDDQISNIIAAEKIGCTAVLVNNDEDYNGLYLSKLY